MTPKKFMLKEAWQTFWLWLRGPLDRWRYAILSRHLGIPENILKGRERGFVILQIDGLSCSMLRRAMARGQAPFLKRLVTRRGYRFRPLFIGLPTSTPAVQFGLFHGDNFGIPGFRWLEKREQVYVDFGNPLSAGWVEERMAARVRPGLLTYGSCYTSLITGGAKRAVFTTSTLSQYRLFSGLRQFDLFLAGLLSPYYALATFTEGCRQWWLEFTLQLRLWRRTGRFTFHDYFPLMRIIAHVIFRNWTTFGVRLDIFRGVPAIYANFIGLDDVAHHHGAKHPHLWGIIKDIDRSIRQIDQAIRQQKHRPYDLFILSDHGIAPSVPFEERFGVTLERLVRDLVGREVFIPQPHPEVSRRIAALLAELAALEERVARRYRPLVVQAARFLIRRLPREQERFDWEHLKDLTLTFSSAFAHLYLHVAPERLKLSEIAALYPRLIPGLLEHPGIGGLLVLTEDGPYLLTRAVEVALGDGDSRSPRLPRALDDHREHARYLARQLAYLGSMPNVGDVVIFGAYLADRGVVINFEGHRGTHGTYQAEQLDAFFISPPHVDWRIEGVTNSKDLYPLFWNDYAAAWLEGGVTPVDGSSGTIGRIKAATSS